MAHAFRAECNSAIPGGAGRGWRSWFGGKAGWLVEFVPLRRRNRYAALEREARALGALSIGVNDECLDYRRHRQRRPCGY